MSRVTGRVMRRETSTAASNASTAASPAAPITARTSEARRLYTDAVRPWPVNRTSSVPIRWLPEVSSRLMIPLESPVLVSVETTTRPWASSTAACAPSLSASVSAGARSTSYQPGLPVL